VASAIHDLDALKRFLRSRAPVIRPEKEVVASGLGALDRLLEGGFPRGAITTISGLSGTGRMTIAARVMASFTRDEHAVAWIDGKGTTYPPALALEGVDLSRLLMVRDPSGGSGPRKSGERVIQAAHQIIDSGAFGVVVVSGLDAHLTPASMRRVQTASEGRSVCTIVLLDPRSSSTISNAELKLRVLRRSQGLVVEVDKNRNRPLHGRAFIELSC
jgi:RecA/RadA recombinase